jgi:hypothetical protein
MSIDHVQTQKRLPMAVSSIAIEQPLTRRFLAMHLLLQVMAGREENRPSGGRVETADACLYLAGAS